MKNLMITILALSVSFSALASGGSRSGGRTNLGLKNSMAGFVSESLEHSMRVFYRTNAASKDLVLNASVDRISQDESTVVIELEDGSAFTYNCLRFDDWSRSGTVLKKEVVCR